MDSNELSEPLLQKSSGNRHQQFSFPRQTLTKPLNLKHGRRKSTVIKQSVRRRSDYQFDSIRLTSSAISVDTGYSEVTERISNVEDTPEHNATVDEDEFEVTSLTKAKSAIVILTTLTSITFYAISFPELILMSNLPTLHLPILAIAAGISLLLTPIVWLNEWKLLRYPSIRRTVNCLRREANNLQREINFLNLEVSELQTEIEGMEEGNERLKNVKMVQDKNIGEIVDLVRENQEILDEMRVSFFVVINKVKVLALLLLFVLCSFLCKTWYIKLYFLQSRHLQTDVGVPPTSSTPRYHQKHPS